MLEGITVRETCTLPSKGLVYGRTINPQVELKSMTTEHEMIRLSDTEMPYKSMCEVIDDCMINKLGISSYDLCFGDYQFLLHKLRIVTYGSIYQLDTVCPYCSQLNTVKVDLEQLKVAEYTPDVEELMHITLPRSGKEIELRLQTPRMIDTINQRKKEMLKKSKGTRGDQSLIYLLESEIKTIDGRVYDPVELENFVRNLPMMDTNIILQTAEKLNTKVGIEPVAECTCSLCGVDYKSNFPLSREFLRPTID